MREKDLSCLVRFREGERRWERETLSFVPLTCVCVFVVKLCSKKWVLYFVQNAPFCAKFCTKCCKNIGTDLYMGWQPASTSYYNFLKSTQTLRLLFIFIGIRWIHVSL
ncbi:hypothetical protein WN943_020413 [Citrus x changshan-huyou]